MPRSPSWAISVKIDRGSVPASNQSATSGSTRSVTNSRTVSRIRRSSAVSWSSMRSKSEDITAGSLLTRVGFGIGVLNSRQGLFHHNRELIDRGVVKQVGNRDFTAHLAANPDDEAQRDKRVPVQVEEIVRSAYLCFEHALPDSQQGGRHGDVACGAASRLPFTHANRVSRAVSSSDLTPH